MGTMVTMSKWLRFSIFCSSQIALAHQPVHVRMTLTILLLSIGVKQLLDCPILPKIALFSTLFYKGTRSQTGCALIKVLGVKQVEF